MTPGGDSIGREAEADLFRVFHEEADDLLAQLESALLSLEADPGRRDLIDEVFRLLHTIKGTCAMYGFSTASTLAHEVETLFDRARSGALVVSTDLIELALSTRDAVVSLLSGSEAECENGRLATQPLMDGMQAFMAVGEATTDADVGSSARGTRVADANADGAARSGALRVSISPRGDVFLRGVNLTGVLEEISSCGGSAFWVDTSKVPSLEDIDPEQCYLTFVATIRDGADPACISDSLMFLDHSEFAIEDVGDAVSLSAEHKAAHEGGDAHSHRAAVSAGVRVSSDRLDELVALVGELVTTQTLLRDVAAESPDQRLVDVAEVIERLSHELRQSVLDMRMVPIGSTFGRFTRYVRDLAKELGKDVVLVTEGGSAELDRSVIDRIEEPLLHIIRNCLDHGIETPVDRRLAGKPETGTVTLSAFHQGGSVYVRVTDDGRGIDIDAVRSKAVALGLTAQDDVLDGQLLAALVCSPGFSTATRVTLLSGRGVGLDVVRKAVEDLQGALEIQSQPGVGTVTTLRLPLTLAIIESLLVGVADERYILPLSNVLECVELEEQPAWKSHGRQLFEVRDELLPFVRLRDFFGVAGSAPPDAIAVVVEVEGERFGVVVDQVIDRMQVVSKSLGRSLRRADGVVGATMLGDGSVALIVDVGRMQRITAGDPAGGDTVATQSGNVGASQSSRRRPSRPGRDG